MFRRNKIPKYEVETVSTQLRTMRTHIADVNATLSTLLTKVNNIEQRQTDAMTTADEHLGDWLQLMRGDVPAHAHKSLGGTVMRDVAQKATAERFDGSPK